MKKINKILLLMMMILPFTVFAAGGVSVNKSNMSFDIGGSDSFNVTASNSAGRIDFISNNTSVCTVSQSSRWFDNDSSTVTVKGVSAGSCTITISINVATYDNEAIKTTKTINVNVKTPKSSVNTLSNLTINGSTISGFSSSKTSYNLGNKDVSSITIGGSVTDSKSSISGTGKKNLNYGKNNFYVVVTAENGSKKTYTITVTRPDPRSTNNNLKELSVDFDKLNFDVNNTYYSYKVNHDLEKITINGTAEDSKSKISGLGTFTLKDYINEFKIVVTAENKTTKTYLIKVIRKDENGNYGKLNSDSSLKSLSIKDQNITFNKDIKNYDLLISEDINELVFNATPNENTSIVTVEGNRNLVPGLNKVIVTVTAEDDSKTHYNFDVYKKGEIILGDEISTSLSNNVWFFVTIFETLVIIVFILLYFLLLKKDTNKKNKK